MPLGGVDFSAYQRQKLQQPKQNLRQSRSGTLNKSELAVTLKDRNMTEPWPPSGLAVELGSGLDIQLKAM